MEASPSHSKTRNPLPIRSASDLDSASASIQNLSSILNNPSSSAYYYSPWSLWPSAGSSAGDLSSAPPITLPSPLPDVPRSDFSPYLARISELYSRFEDIINHSLNETTNLEDSSRGGAGGQGEALVACLREVPSLFFKEDFALEDGATFKSACPFSPSQDENLALQERLTQYLDTVEMHLVREIALRSDSFFEAQGQLQGLDGEIVEACVRIRELKEGIRVLTGDLVGSVKQAQELNAARGNLVGLQQKLTVILYVSQALSALKLVSLCVKRLVYTNDQGEIVKGVCSNFLCDLKPGAEAKITGPVGKEMLMSKDPNATIIMLATGTRIASFRSFLWKMFFEKHDDYKLVVAADCAGALDVIDDLQHLLAISFSITEKSLFICFPFEVLGPK